MGSPSHTSKVVWDPRKHPKSGKGNANHGLGLRGTCEETHAGPLQTSALPLGYGANCLLGLELKWALTVTEGSDFAGTLPASVSREALGLFCGASAASRSGRRGRYSKNVEWMEKVSDEQYRR